MIVSEIWRYPVTSAQGEPVCRSVVTGVGLEGDRGLAIVDIGAGRALTGRRRQPEYDFPVNPEDESGEWDVWSGPAGVWHDSARTQVSILSTTSLAAWPIRRFRPNVLVDGSDEDQLVGRRIAIGSVVLDVMKKIDRCVMVNRPQPEGIERDRSVLRTVMREREGFLGVGALVARPGEMEAGDDLRELGPSPAVVR